MFLLLVLNAYFLQLNLDYYKNLEYLLDIKDNSEDYDIEDDSEDYDIITDQS